MATRWRYRLSGREFGPVAFRELVSLVRNGTLRPDDLVRGEWEDDWHPAATVVGLFHMAQREDVWEQWQAEALQKSADESGAHDEHELAESVSQAGKENVDQGGGDSLPADLEGSMPPQPSWLRRLREVTSRRSAAASARRDVQRLEADARRLERQIQDATSAAVARSERRRASRPFQQWQQALSSRFSPNTLRAVFRLAMALVVANLTAWGILSWSTAQSQRFPDPQALAQGVRQFPLWGACQPSEFLFLLLDAIAISGLLGYISARALESLTDE